MCSASWRWVCSVCSRWVCCLGVVMSRTPVCYHPITRVLLCQPVFLFEYMHSHVNGYYYYYKC
jgi:hypothetical protein